MVLGIIVFGAVFLVGLAVGTATRRPLATASLVVAAFVAVLVVQTHEPLAGFGNIYEREAEPAHQPVEHVAVEAADGRTTRLHDVELCAPARRQCLR